MYSKDREFFQNSEVRTQMALFRLYLEFLTNLIAIKYLNIADTYLLWKVDVHQSEIGTIQNVLEDASEIMWKLEDELKFLTEFSSDLPDLPESFYQVLVLTDEWLEH